MKIKTLTQGAIIAAIYVALTLLSNAAGMANGVFQLRLSEALSLLPLFTEAAIPGLTIGCLIANIITGCALPDIIFGSVATLIGALGTFAIGKLIKTKNARIYLGMIPPIAANTAIIPILLTRVYGLDKALWLIVVSIAASEIISAGILGALLYKLVKRTKVFEQKDK